MKYKPFDLEAAKRGEPCVTRDKREAKLVFVSELPTDVYPLLFVIPSFNGSEFISKWVKANGKHFEEEQEYDFDIFMLPKTKTYWVNVYKGVLGRPLLGEATIAKDYPNNEYPNFMKQISFEVEE